MVQSQLSTVREEKRSLETDIASLTEQLAAKGLKVLTCWYSSGPHVGQLWAQSLLFIDMLLFCYLLLLLTEVDFVLLSARTKEVSLQCVVYTYETSVVN